MEQEGVAAEMALRREAFLDRVKERGEYDTVEEAERAARVVLPCSARTWSAKPAPSSRHACRRNAP